jgi:hypothetical protein
MGRLNQCSVRKCDVINDFLLQETEPFEFVTKECATNIT